MNDKPKIPKGMSRRVCCHVEEGVRASMNELVARLVESGQPDAAVTVAAWRKRVLKAATDRIIGDIVLAYTFDQPKATP